VNGLLTVPADDPLLVSALARRLAADGIGTDEMGLRLPSLDEVFLALTGHPATTDDEKNDDTIAERTAA